MSIITNNQHQKSSCLDRTGIFENSPTYRRLSSNGCVRFRLSVLGPELGTRGASQTTTAEVNTHCLFVVGVLPIRYGEAVTDFLATSLKKRITLRSQIGRRRHTKHKTARAWICLLEVY